MPIEWNTIPLPATFTLTHSDAFGVNVDEVEVRRGPKLDLETVVRATTLPERRPDPVPGSEARGVQVRATTRHHDGAILEGYITRNTSTTSRGRGSETTIDGRIWAARIEHGEGDCASRYEWLANVPQRLWPRATERRSGGPSRQRDDENIMAPDPGGGGWSRDYARCDLKLPTLEFIRVGAVPSELVTEGEPIIGPGFIQFARGPQGMPNEQMRHSLCRALEFLFGGGLGVLGACDVDSGFIPIRSEVLTPYIAGGGGRNPPALLDATMVDGINETLVTRFLTAYLAHAAELDLDRVVWLYLHAHGAPLDMAAGYDGAAFEILRRGFYERPANAERSRQLPRKEWRLTQAALSRALADFARTPDGQTHGVALKEVEKKLGQLNNVSGTRLNKLFLDDLGLAHGQTEEEALSARNDAAHGNRLADSDQWPALQAHHALHTLVARAMFAVLKVDVRYIDYSALHHPVRALRDAQGNRK